MNHLSEDQITTIAVQYLKTYYKSRPRYGQNEVKKNIVASGGIVVDGYLKFYKDKQLTKEFFATIESTSIDKIGEVRYTVQRKLLFWDSLAFASLGAAIIKSFAYESQFFTIKHIGLLPNIALLIAIFLVLAFIYFLFSKAFSRYRYIYAVEQFKRYYADEQWIAMAEDVFNNPENPYLKELKYQCVYNGFGLMMIDKDEEAHLHITPAREQVSKKKRKKKKFQDRISNKTAKAQLAKVSKIWRKLKEIFLRSTTETDLFRFTRSYFSQIMICLFGFGILGGVYYQQYRDRDVVYENEEKYNQRLAELAASSEPESKEIVIDTAVLNRGNPLGSYFGIDDDDDPAFAKLEEERITPEPTRDFIVGIDGDARVYDCSRFYNFKNRVYLIQDGLFENLEFATDRINELRGQKINANILWLGCFSTKLNVYVVYYDYWYETEQEAQQRLKYYKDIKERRRINLGDQLIRSFYRKSK